MAMNTHSGNWDSHWISGGRRSYTFPSGITAETHDSQSQLPRQSRDSTHSLPVVRDTFKVSGNTHRTSGHHQSSQQPRHHRQSVDHHDTTSLNSSVFDFLSYSEVDSGQRQEFQFLLAKVCVCVCCFQ